MGRVTIPGLYQLKAEHQKILMLTAYNYTMARILDRTQVHMVLIGDSLGMTSLGYSSTLPVTMEDMCRATAAVARGCTQKMIVADMPFLSYQASLESAVLNAGKLMQNGAQAIKIEGAHHLTEIKAIINAGIPVMGHLGFTPQSLFKLGGYRVQAKTEDTACVLMEEARALAQAGVFALVLEMVPAAVAAEIAAELGILTIGIGAGAQTDGQVLVIDDVLGLYDEVKPKFVKRYANLAAEIEIAINGFCQEVQGGIFPDEAHSY